MTCATITVVVHILQFENNEISDEQVNSQIKVLNQDFNKINPDKDNILKYPDFALLQSDIKIKFELAKRDPNGQCTNGIERRLTYSTVFTNKDVTKDYAKFFSKGGLDAWDASKYLNIWVCKLTGNIGGYAQFPGYIRNLVNGTGLDTDGVVINYSNFGTTGNLTISYDLGRNTTHEVGHWLNLYHIWGDTLCGNDHVADTPKQYNFNFFDPPYPKLSYCDNIESIDMTMNYMDYTVDKAKYMFTTGQKDRMRTALMSDYRNTIISPDNLALVPPKAELTIINQSVSNNQVVAGNSITVYFAENNDGALPAALNNVNFHFSTDAILTPGQNGDSYLDQYVVAQGVSARSCSLEFNKEINIPATTAPGNYFLILAADGTFLVDECNKSNNFASVKITVTSSTTNNPPRNLTAIAGDKQVLLSWKAPLSGTPSTYSIYKSASENGTYTQIATTTTITKTITGLSNGNKYWFFVEAVYPTGEVASFKVSATPYTPVFVTNDDCSGAIKLTSSTSCNFLEKQTVNNATASGKPKGLCDAYTSAAALADVWYYFVAQSTSQTITVDPNGSLLDAVISAYNSCSGSEISCSDTTGGPGVVSTLNLTGLTVGNPYYIRVYDYGMQTTSGNFRICVTGATSANSCAISVITPSASTHSASSFATTQGVDNINFLGQPNCSYEITNYCSWLTVTPIFGTTDSAGNGSVNYSFEANTTNTVRQCTFYINGSPVIITQNGETFIDDDNDGVKNELDKCPNTPTGEIVDANGCSDNQLITEINSLQYNDVILNTPNDRIIYFANNGTTDYSITSVNITGVNANQFTYTPVLPIVVAAGSYQNLTVIFNPTSLGAKTATMQVTTDDAAIPLNTITLNGNGVDHLTRVLFSDLATSYNFGDTKVGDALTKTIMLENTGSGTVTVSELAFEGLNNSDFSISSQVTLPFDIASGEFKVFVVAFLPTSNGSKNALFKITNNSDNLAPSYAIQLYGNAIEDIYSGNNNTLSAYEYWFDDQYNAKVRTVVNTYGEVYLNAQFNTVQLKMGLHTLNIRYRDKTGKWSPLLSHYFFKMNKGKFAKGEYWFDDDYASKAALPISDERTIQLNSGLDVNATTNGLHTLNIRYKDDVGQWSSVLSQYIYKLTKGKITSAEYWFDDEYTSKASIPITEGQTILLNTGLDVNTVANGLHSFNIRFKDDVGQWSSVMSQYIYKLTKGKITSAEYWFDDEYASKASIPITVGQTILLNTGLELSDASNGLHSFNIRFKDDVGQWSSIQSSYFFKVKIDLLDSKIISYRYWLNNDFTKVVEVNINVPDQIFVLDDLIDLSSNTSGANTINFQFKDSKGQWSSVFTQTFDLITLSVIENTFKKDILVYPNPTNGIVYLDFGSLYNKISIKIYDINGRIVKEMSVNNSQKFNIDLNMASGVYNMIIKSDNKIAIFKIIKK